MFLPNALPNAVLGRIRTKHQSPARPSGEGHEGGSAVGAAAMTLAGAVVRRRWKPHHSASVELVNDEGGGHGAVRGFEAQPRSFVAKSWDRLSGRRRRRKRREGNGHRKNPLPLDEQTPTHAGGGGPHPSAPATEAFQFQGWEGMDEEAAATTAEASNNPTPSSSSNPMQNRNLPTRDDHAQQQQLPPKSLEERVDPAGEDKTRGPLIRRGMDRLRRSLRIPFRRGSHRSNYSATMTAPQTTQLSSQPRHDAGEVTVDSDSGSPRTSTMPKTPSGGDCQLQQPKARGGVSNFARTLLGRSMRVGRQQRPIQRQEDAAMNNIRVRSGGKADKNGFAQFDEIAVRSSACSFLVKYLGSCEVFESRGIQVCESALQHLRARKQYTKALLYVSGDAIRVVDQGNSRGLIVDQTIEKVSFCAPDRHNTKGFAYICREGATRRWMCHGFQSMRESGERISHAVGCAFSVCLEKKRKRDAETAAFKSAQSLHTQSSRVGEDLNAAWSEPLHAESSPTSSGSVGFGFQGKGGAGGILVNNGDLSSTAHRINPAYSSFRRQLSIAERRRDPQTAIVNVPAPPLNGTTTAVPRSVSLGESSEVTVRGTGVSIDPSTSATGTAVSRSRPMGTSNASLLSFEDGSHLDGEGAGYTSREGVSIPFRRFNSLGSHNAIAMPACRSLYGIKTLFNEPIYEGDLDESYSNEPPPASQTLSPGILPTPQYNPTVTSDRAESSFMIKPLAAATDGNNHQAEEWLNEAFHASLYFVQPSSLTASGKIEAAPLSTPGAITSPRPPATWTSFDDTNNFATSLKNSQAPLMKLENGTTFAPSGTSKIPPHARAEKTNYARSDQGESRLRETTTAETRKKTTKLGTTLGTLFV